MTPPRPTATIAAVPTTRKSSTESSTRDRDAEVERALARAEATIARATRLRPFDPANYLKTDEDIASYRESAAADGDPEIIIEAQALLGSNAFFPPIFCLRLCDR